MITKIIKKGHIKIIGKNPEGKDIQDMVWDQMFDQMLKFKKKYGHCNVPQQNGKNAFNPELKKLASWVATQRRFCKKGILLEHRKKRLVESGFVFDPFEVKWEEKFKMLLEYKEKHGHCNVPHNKKNLDPLALWVNKQRNKRNTISEEKKRRLLEIGFVFEVLNTWWEEYFQELVEFKNKFGHCNVSEWSEEYYTLGKWVSKIRFAKRYGKKTWLTVEQEKRLNKLGFEWEPELKKWENHYNDLLKFFNENGHTIVPKTYSEIEGLATWVFHLREVKNNLTKEQIKKLNLLGFEWDNEVAFRTHLVLRRIKKNSKNDSEK